MSEECHVFKEIKKVKIPKTSKQKLNIIKKYMPRDEYLSHLERLKNMWSETDNKAPQFMLSTFCPVSEYLRDNNRLEGIVKENLFLLGRLSDIARSHSIYHKKHDHTCSATNVTSYILRLQFVERVEKENIVLANRLTTVSGEIASVKKLNKEWEYILLAIRRACQHKLVLPELMAKHSISYIEKNHPMVYLDLGERNSRPLGRITIMLYLDLAPRTVKNFIDLCENHRNWSNPSLHKNEQQNNNNKDTCSCSPKEDLNNSIDNGSYEYISKNCQLLGTKFTRIFPNLFIYGGNLKNDKNPNFRGILDYEPEKFKLTHNYKGTLSMCPMENGLINSEFTISLKPLHVLNGKRLVFGRVIRGMGILDQISSYGTKNGKPQKNVEILDCGILNLNLE